MELRHLIVATALATTGCGPSLKLGEYDHSGDLSDSEDSYSDSRGDLNTSGGDPWIGELTDDGFTIIKVDGDGSWFLLDCIQSGRHFICEDERDNDSPDSESIGLGTIHTATRFQLTFLDIYHWESNDGESGTNTFSYTATYEWASKLDKEDAARMIEYDRSH